MNVNLDLEPLVEAVAARVLEQLEAQRAPEPEPWIGVEEAATYLAAPTSRIYSLVSAKRIPYRKDGSRLLFRRSELDTWLDGGGARRP